MAPCTHKSFQFQHPADGHAYRYVCGRQLSQVTGGVRHISEVPQCSCMQAASMETLKSNSWAVPPKEMADAEPSTETWDCSILRPCAVEVELALAVAVFLLTAAQTLTRADAQARATASTHESALTKACTQQC